MKKLSVDKFLSASKKNRNDLPVNNVIPNFFYFNGDISNWNVGNVKNMYSMFANSKFNNDISNWNVSNIIIMRGMFFNSEFNGDISNWDVSNVEDMEGMFYKSSLEKNPPKWYKKK